MSITVTAGMTLWDLAQTYLGSGLRWHELQGYTGDPHKMPIGTVIYLPNEVAGPPARGLASPTPEQTEAASWEAVPAEQRNLLMDLEHQYEQMTGFRAKLSRADLIQMAQNNVTSMFDFAQIAYGKQSAEFQAANPGAQFGMNVDQFAAATQAYQDYYSQLTGAQLTHEQIAQFLKENRGQLNMQHVQQSIQQDKKLRETFGWVKYGMNYMQFADFKEAHQRQYGKSLSDKEGMGLLTEQAAEQAAPVQGGKEIVAGSKNSGQKSTGDPLGQSSVR